VYGFSNDEYLYLMVNKKYGNAPNRNLFKRRARALFNNLAQQHSLLSLGLMIKPLKQNVSHKDLKSCFELLNKKIIENQ
jgi:ribonuclease P protein component